MKKRFLLTILSTLLTMQNLFILPGIAFNKLSRKQEEKLNELSNTSKPDIPIFGKIDSPLKAGISIFQSLPQTINLAPKDDSTIKLEPKEKENLSLL